MSEKIKLLRASQPTKHTQESFGEKIGVSRDMINNFENNRSEPSESLLRLICRVYHVNYAWLKGEDESAPMFAPEKENERVLDLLDGDNEFAKRTMRVLASLDADQWRLLEGLIVGLSEKGTEEQKDGQA
ncbi:MAG: helix-turn-helix transcriptional regulator [Clostridia bacterium]|nr:helix-turn-helix transcriptional regulator [Clostridia bacterium]